MSFIDILAEQRILTAQRNGDFNNLPGHGKPLVESDDALLSPEQRMLNHVLHEAGVVPQDVLLRRDLALVRKHLHELDKNSAEYRKLHRRMAELLLEIAVLR